MNILGLHFGHDANVTVLRDGRVASYVLRERHCRIKHAYSLDQSSLRLALGDAGLQVGDIDYCALTSTQGCDAVLDKLGRFQIHLRTEPHDGIPCPFLDELRSLGRSCEDLRSPSMVHRVLGVPKDPTTHPAFDAYLSEYKAKPASAWKTFRWLEFPAPLGLWTQPRGLRDIASADLSKYLDSPSARYGFHYPVDVTIEGHVIPGSIVDHHLSHAASSYYRSGFDHAVVITADGYGGLRTLFNNGGIYIGRGASLTPVYPHATTHGSMYDYVGLHLGLGPVGAAGKLMGLSGYGSDRFFDSRFVGNRFDWEVEGLIPTPEAWIAHCRGADTQYAAAPDGKSSETPFSRFDCDLAASTQRLFEETVSLLRHVACTWVERSGLPSDNLCMSGGASLNCPANSRVYAEHAGGSLFIEPNCDDGGLSTGAAFFVAHMLLGEERALDARLNPSEAYCGAAYPAAACSEALRASDTAIGFSRVEKPAFMAAVDISNDLVVGWYQGSGELGPRALGHRSILANPLNVQMRRRVNEIKDREQWRPLAPAVLEGHAAGHFDGIPEPSPFMLFAGYVISDDLAAITHVDGTARPQTVGRYDGAFYDLLLELKRLIGFPVVLNTSLNGRGEPIIETPAQAVEFLRTGSIDVLYLGDYRAVRSRSGNDQSDASVIE